MARHPTGPLFRLGPLSDFSTPNLHTFCMGSVGRKVCAFICRRSYPTDLCDRYLNRETWLMFVVNLWILAILFCIWFYAICGIAGKFLQGAPVEDTRSDDEDAG